MESASDLDKLDKLDIHTVLLDQSFGALQELTSATLDSLPSTSNKDSLHQVALGHVDLNHDFVDSRTFQLDWSCLTDTSVFPDISVLSRDGSLRAAHRIILSRLGRYVSSLLIDTENDETPVLVFPDFSSRIVDILLQLAYTGEARLTENDVLEVTNICSLLNVQQDFSVENVIPDTYVSVDVIPVAKIDPTWEHLDQGESPVLVEAAQCPDVGPNEVVPDIGHNIVVPCPDIGRNIVVPCPDIGRNIVVPCPDIVRNNEVPCPDIDRNNMVHCPDIVVPCPDLGRNNVLPCPDAGGNIVIPIPDIGRNAPASQCGFCGKSFIYPKSYERHIVDCEKNLSQKESLTETLNVIENDSDERTEHVEMFDEAVNNSADVDDPDAMSDDSKQRHRQKEVFKFVHYEKRGELYFCTFPGCDYDQGQKTLGGCKNHQLRHHATDEEKIFSCKFCPERFATNQLRNKHQNIAHNKRFPCITCGKIFSERSRLFIHSRIHTGEKPFVCEECGFSCAQRDNLRLHKQFKHPGGRQNKKHNCDMCSASFLTKSNLTRHRMTHTSFKDYVCETCGKAFKDSGALKQHNFSHGSADFVCSECHMRFTSPLYLSRHMDRKHPMDGVQPFTCGVCSRGFPLNYQLQEHIQAVHENVKHCCPHCDLAIGRRSSVHRHIKKGRCPVHSRLQFLAAAESLLPMTSIIHTIPTMTS